MTIAWQDWLVLSGSLAFIILYGIYVPGKNITSAEDFLKNKGEVKWWTIGLSVMATQASAITFMSTPGQAFHDGMGFVQFVRHGTATDILAQSISTLQRVQAVQVVHRQRQDSFKLP